MGFDATLGTEKYGIGLASMRERMTLVGGDFSVESKRGHGTTIRARVPIF
jgi:signal transduction histidine kinase